MTYGPCQAPVVPAQPQQAHVQYLRAQPKLLVRVQYQDGLFRLGVDSGSMFHAHGKPQAVRRARLKGNRVPRSG